MSLGCHKFLDENEKEIISLCVCSFLRSVVVAGVARFDELAVYVWCAFLQSFVFAGCFCRSKSMMSTMITATCVQYVCAASSSVSVVGYFAEGTTLEN